MSAKTPAPIRPEHLPRLFAWALLWLVKYAWHLAHGGPEAKRHLKEMARIIANLIVIRAAHRFPKSAPRKTFRPLSPPPGFAWRACSSPKVMKRALIGSALRRRLNARTAGVRLCRLLNALFDLDALTRHVARRFARRLTRLWPIVPVRPPAHALTHCACAPAPLCADTS